jgi:drug/metabolite transporter (DMT)-like permease
LRPGRPGLVAARAVANLFSVVLFMYGVQLSTVSKANMLNLSYLVFVFVAAPLLNRERFPRTHLLYLAASAAGLYLIIRPDFGVVNPGDALALASGVIGAVAISLLRETRKTESTLVVLASLMGIGAAGSGLMMLPTFVVPDAGELLALLLSAAAGVIGQLLTTMSFGTLDATTGTLVTSSRIVFAVALGAFWFGEPVTLPIVAGALLVLGAVLGVSGSFERGRSARPRP